MPGLLAEDIIDVPSGTMHLQPTDGAQELWLDLDQGGVSRAGLSMATTSVRGTGSDLLLWMTNRDPIDANVDGNRDTFINWTKLQR